MSDFVRLARELRSAMQAYAANATELSDEQALTMPSLFPRWALLLSQGRPLALGAVIEKDGQLYRVMQDKITPQEHQPPGGEGMLAVYRPIDAEHAGTIEDPIPWTDGMDCHSGKYYRHDGQKWICKGDMIPCVWEPGTVGVWQWEIATDNTVDI